MAGKRQLGRTGGDKGRLEAARIYSQSCIRLARRAGKKGYQEWQASGNRDRQVSTRAEGSRIYSQSCIRLARRAGKRQPGQAGGDKGRLEAARIYSQSCISLVSGLNGGKRQAEQVGQEVEKGRLEGLSRMAGKRQAEQVCQEVEWAGEKGRQGGQARRAGKEGRELVG